MRSQSKYAANFQMKSDQRCFIKLHNDWENDVPKFVINCLSETGGFRVVFQTPDQEIAERHDKTTNYMTCFVANVCFKTCSRQHPILSKHNDMGNYRLHETTDAIALKYRRRAYAQKKWKTTNWKLKITFSCFIFTFIQLYNLDYCYQLTHFHFIRYKQWADKLER